MSLNKKRESLKKMNIIELKEMLNRETALVNNSKLLAKLPDKGDSVRQFREILENEIKYREKVTYLEQAASHLSLLDDAQQHVKKVCEFEKNPEKDRYKPFATLNKTIEIKPDRKVFKIMENCKLENHPTKLIPLPESMNILKQQEERTKEEQVKIRYERLMDKLKQNHNEAKSDTDDDNSDKSSISEEESD